MTDILIVLIKCSAAVLVGIIAGNGAVYFFNKMPAQWMCEYGEEPSEQLKDPYTQRVKSYPWKYIFTMVLVVVNIKLVMDDWRFAIGAQCVIWLLLEIAIADIKYRIIPDQLVILLAVSALGFITYHNGWKDCFLGGIAGFGIMFFIALIGKMAYKRDSLGGGDIKLFASIGLIAGFSGVLIIFVITTLLSSGHMVYLMARKKLRRTDTVAMAPYIGIATAVYLIFLWGMEDVLYL